MSKRNQDDKRVFDVYVSLSTMPQDRLLIEITERQDFHNLVQKIEESLVMTYDHFKGLRGIRVKEMKKYQTLLQNQKHEFML